MFGRAVPQYQEIVLVHRQNIVEMLEVFVNDTPRTDIVQQEAATLSRGPGTPVGWLIDVIRIGACRIDADTGIQTGITDDFAENALGRRRETDVAHADKQYGYFFCDFSHLLRFSCQ